jgi:hypothetical protein
VSTYDTKDIVRQPHLLRAGPLKLAAYRVRDIETGEFSKLQFHMTYDNTVMAVMEESSAKLFCKFVTDTLAVNA